MKLTICRFRFAVAACEATVRTSKGTFEIRTALSDREKRLILCGGLLASL